VGFDLLHHRANGQVTVPPGQATPGYHSLQIEKVAAGGLPLGVRLAPDYTVLIERQVSLTAAEPTADLTAPPPQYPCG
jgi:hypothetical protein